jgi:uncharacterized protein
VRLFIGSDGKPRLSWRFLISFFATLAVVIFSGWIPDGLGVSGIFGLFLGRLGGAVALLGLYIFLLQSADHSLRPLAELGFPRPGAPPFLTGFAFASAMISLAVGAIAIIGRYAVHFNPTTTSAGVFFTLGTLLSGAIFEELAFRGYAFQRFSEITHPAFATVVFSLLFGAVHLLNPSWSWIAFVNTVSVGILFAIAYLRTGSLWVVWGMHFGWNLMLGTIFGLPVSGFVFFSVLAQGQATGPALLTGGDYGLEGSLTGTAVILMGIVFVPLVFPLRGSKTAGTEGSI